MDYEVDFSIFLCADFCKILSKSRQKAAKALAFLIYVCIARFFNAEFGKRLPKRRA